MREYKAYRKLEFAALKLGEVEDLVDDDEEILAAAINHLHKVQLLRLELRVEQQLRGANDSVQWCANLVALESTKCIIKEKKSG